MSAASYTPFNANYGLQAHFAIEVRPCLPSCASGSIHLAEPKAWFALSVLARKGVSLSWLFSQLSVAMRTTAERYVARRISTSPVLPRPPDCRARRPAPAKVHVQVWESVGVAKSGARWPPSEDHICILLWAPGSRSVTLANTAGQ